MIVGVCSDQNACLLFVNLFLFIGNTSEIEFYIDGAIENREEKELISSFRIYFRQLADLRVIAYQPETILDAKHRRNQDYSRVLPNPGTKPEIVFDKYPPLKVKRVNAGLQDAPSPGVEEIGVSVDGGIPPGEAVFFRLQCQAKSTPFIRGRFIRSITLQNYPNAYYLLPTTTETFVTQIQDQLVPLEELKQWLTLPIGYSFLNPPALVDRRQGAEFLMLREYHPETARSAYQVSFASKYLVSVYSARNGRS